MSTFRFSPNLDLDLKAVKNPFSEKKVELVLMEEEFPFFIS